MNKTKFIIIVIIMIVLFSFVIFMNYDQINNFINNKQWELIDSIAQIYPDKYLKASGAGEKILVIESDKISAYTNTNIPDYKQSVNFKDIVVDSNGDYCVIGENGGSNLVLLNEKGKVWDFNVNGEILAVSVNKNGYVACVYSKSGYKSLIKVINPSGEELFTNYLASTYAVDAEISNDNKYLAIAEVNTEGINMESDIKVVDINNASEKELKTIKLEGNSLVLDVEYGDKNDLLILEDTKIEKVNSNYEKSTIKEYKSNDASHVSIENGTNAIAIEKNDTGIFSTEYILKIYDGNNEPKEYTLEGSAKSVHAQGKTICVDVGNEILFLNNNGKLLKRCRVSGQARDVKMYDNGSMAAIIFKDRIEIVKL